MGIQINESLLKKLSIGATEDQLKTMKRDLRFFPCRNMNPLNLSPQEIEEFNQDGYLKGIDIFNEKEIKKYRSFFDHHLTEAMSGKFHASQARQAHGQGRRVSHDSLRRRADHRQGQQGVPRVAGRPPALAARPRNARPATPVAPTAKAQISRETARQCHSYGSPLPLRDSVSIW